MSVVVLGPVLGVPATAQPSERAPGRVSSAVTDARDRDVAVDLRRVRVGADRRTLTVRFTLGAPVTELRRDEMGVVVGRGSSRVVIRIRSSGDGVVRAVVRQPHRPRRVVGVARSGDGRRFVVSIARRAVPAYDTRARWSAWSLSKAVAEVWDFAPDHGAVDPVS